MRHGSSHRAGSPAAPPCSSIRASISFRKGATCSIWRARGHCLDPVHPCLSRGRDHYRQPVYPAGASIRVRARRPPVPDQRPADAGGHGADVHGGASLAAVGGSWAVSANQYGRYAALALLALFGVTLLFPACRTGSRGRWSRSARGFRTERTRRAKAGSAPRCCSASRPGLLWAPCAGPILGLVLTGAALQGANAGTTLLLLCYALARRPRSRWRWWSAGGCSRR